MTGRLEAYPTDSSGRRDACPTPADLMRLVDTQLAHVWMVRAFLKHSDETAEDDELAEVHRELYDYMLALGAPLKAGDANEYLKVARKKLAKLRRATELFVRIQPEISQHTNFQMAALSLTAAVARISQLLDANSPSSVGAKLD